MQMVPLKHGGAPYEALMNVIFAEAAASFEELTLHDIDDQLRWQDPGAWPNSFRRARFLSAIDHIQLDRLRRHVMQEMDDTFHKVDAIVGPVAHGPMLIITNFTGHPCLTLRSGFLQSRTRGSLSLAQSRIHEGTPGTADARFVPHGICIWGKLFDEGTVLNIGRALECELNVWDRRPPLA
jgi:Asp-tRNA(Asn)/Glu-tRNA(Gln) amidotransferase A subunit family amidase